MRPGYRMQVLKLAACGRRRQARRPESGKAAAGVPPSSLTKSIGLFPTQRVYLRVKVSFLELRLTICTRIWDQIAFND